MIEMRDIPGFEGLYAATEDGRIWSHRSNRMLKVQTGTNGYQIVNLGANNRNQSAHRLVALAFLPAEDGRPFVNHKNGDKSDNRVQNLEWCTASQNIKHAHENQMIKKYRALSSEQAREVRAMSRCYHPKEIARIFGVGVNTVKRCVAGIGYPAGM